MRINPCLVFSASRLRVYSKPQPVRENPFFGTVVTPPPKCNARVIAITFVCDPRHCPSPGPGLLSFYYGCVRGGRKRKMGSSAQLVFWSKEVAWTLRTTFARLGGP